MDLSSKQPDGTPNGFLSYNPLPSSTTDNVKSLEHNDEDTFSVSFELGVDIAEIRARVLGRRMEASQDKEAAMEGDFLTTTEHQEVYKELQNKHQVDLNEESNVVVIEDPNLMAHMEASRRRLAEQERALLRLPRLENLRTKYLNVMGQVSSLIHKLEEQHMSKRENIEISYRQKDVLTDLLHPFTSRKDSGVEKALTLAIKKSEVIAKSYDDLLNFVKDLKQTFFVLRREVEVVGDGFINLIEASEEDRRCLREFLEIASKSHAVRATTGPPESLGEQILTDPVLPEESNLEAYPPNEVEITTTGEKSDGI